MHNRLPISRLRIWRIAIPMRRKFDHAAAARTVAEPLIVEVELSNGVAGYGETHPRTYVTGEDQDSVIAAIREVFVPRLVEFGPTQFGEVIEAASDLPIRSEAGGVICAARAAVELAMLDAYCRAFDRSMASIAGWVSSTHLGLPGSSRTTRFSGVISAGAAAKAARSVRKMRLARLAHFKLKVGDEEDDGRVRACVAALGSGLRKGSTTLRLDANAGWSLAEAASRLEAWEELPITCVEQPLAKGAIDDWAELAARTNLPLMADESLVTPEDAEALIERSAASWFNIRISKNGGLIPSLRLALTAIENNIDIQLGCMVGETSILSAAGRWFLQLVPGVRFAEGSFGRFLLADDVARRSLRFGFGGRWKPMSGPGLGAAVDPERLSRLAVVPALEIPL